MAAVPTLIRVRVPGREYQTVELVLGLSESGVERAVALAVRLAVNSFGLKSDTDGRTAGFHAGLTGDWTAVSLSGEFSWAQLLLHPSLIYISPGFRVWCL